MKYRKYNINVLMKQFYWQINIVYHFEYEIKHNKNNFNLWQNTSKNKQISTLVFAWRNNNYSSRNNYVMCILAVICSQMCGIADENLVIDRTCTVIFYV